MDTSQEQEFDKLLFNVRRSVRYHARRQNFFRNCHTLVMFFALIFSSVTVVAFGAEIATTLPLWIKLLPAALVTLASAADLLFRFSEKAADYAELMRKFIALERQLEASRGDLSEKLITHVTDQSLEIETTEPPVLQVLDTLCYNELLRAMGYSWERQVKVNPVQRWCAHLFDIQAHRLGSREA